MKNQIRLLAFVSMIITGFTLSGCETMGGAGRDIESAGEAVQRSAQ